MRLASGLVSRQQLDEAAARCAATAEGPDRQPIDDRRLADALIENGTLNRWQAKQLLEGQTQFHLGPYQIVDSLGQGGMGQVFRAQHGVLRRPVAVKVLPRDRSTPDAIVSFTREIRAQASLSHDNLVRALDAGHDRSVYYLVSEFVPGCNLRKLVRRVGPLDMATAASIISQAALGLQHAHEMGLVHRDVKPGNILVTPDGHAKLSDLGLAGPLYGDIETDPRFGKIVGTADYLSPDHIKDPWDPTPAWDIYSLGCTLYYAVTGRSPFPGGHHCRQGPGPLRIAADRPPPREPDAERRIHRRHGRHDGQGASRANLHGGGGRCTTRALGGVRDHSCGNSRSLMGYRSRRFRRRYRKQREQHPGTGCQPQARHEAQAGHKAPQPGDIVAFRRRGHRRRFRDRASPNARRLRRLPYGCWCCCSCSCRWPRRFRPSGSWFLGCGKPCPGIGLRLSVFAYPHPN